MYMLLEEYIDGTIGELEKILLEEHLLACPESRRELNRLKVLDWDMRSYFREEIVVPPELIAIRQKAIRECVREVKGEEFSFRDVVNLQFTGLQNSIRFIGLLPGVRRKPVPAKKKKTLLRRIIGL